MKVKKIVVSDIDWCDGSDALPSQIEIVDPDPDLLEDIDSYAENLTEYLSSEYGYLVNGFAVDVEEVDKT